MRFVMIKFIAPTPKPKWAVSLLDVMLVSIVCILKWHLPTYGNLLAFCTENYCTY